MSPTALLASAIRRTPAKRATLLFLASVLAGVPALTWLGIVIVAARPLLGWTLPSSYAEAYLPLVLIASATAINACFGASTNLLLMNGKAGVVSLFSTAQLSSIAIGTLLLAPHWGITGIAATILLGAFCRDAGSMAFLLRSRSRQSLKHRSRKAKKCAPYGAKEKRRAINYSG